MQDTQNTADTTGLFDFVNKAPEKKKQIGEFCFVVMIDQNGNEIESIKAFPKDIAETLVQKLLRTATRNNKGFRSAAKRANGVVQNAFLRTAI